MFLRQWPAAQVELRFGQISALCECCLPSSVHVMCLVTAQQPLAFRKSHLPLQVSLYLNRTRTLTSKTRLNIYSPMQIIQFFIITIDTWSGVHSGGVFTLPSRPYITHKSRERNIPFSLLAPPNLLLFPPLVLVQYRPALAQHDVDVVDHRGGVLVDLLLHRVR